VRNSPVVVRGEMLRGLERIIATTIVLRVD
jgi:hypothetical protein